MCVSLCMLLYVGICLNNIMRPCVCQCVCVCQRVSVILCVFVCVIVCVVMCVIVCVCVIVCCCMCVSFSECHCVWQCLCVPLSVRMSIVIVSMWEFFIVWLFHCIIVSLFMSHCVGYWVRVIVCGIVCKFLVMFVRFKMYVCVCHRVYHCVCLCSSLSMFVVE